MWTLDKCYACSSIKATIRHPRHGRQICASCLGVAPPADGSVAIHPEMEKPPERPLPGTLEARRAK